MIQVKLEIKMKMMHCIGLNREFPRKNRKIEIRSKYKKVRMVSGMISNLKSAKILKNS